MFAGLRERRNIEDFLRGARVNVFTAAESLHQYWIFREVREDAQLDLRVIRGEKQGTGRGNESRANFASELRTDRNILQVRVGRAEPPSHRAGLAKTRVQAAGPGMNQPRKHVGIVRLQFGQLAKFNYLFG